MTNNTTTNNNIQLSISKVECAFILLRIHNIIIISQSDENTIQTRGGSRNLQKGGRSLPSPYSPLFISLSLFLPFPTP